MSEGQHPHSVLRSLGAVFAGLLAVFILSLGTDAALRAAGIFPVWGQLMSDRLFALATIYRCVYAVVGCYLTARLAPSKAMRHALILGAVGVVLSTAGAVATWNRGPAFGPHWYPLALIATAIPCAWIGGRLRGTQAQTRSE